MVTLREYVDRRGRSPFARWLSRLDAVAAARVVTGLVRVEQGNWANVKGVGGGVFEVRVHDGPGYRVYFGKDGESLVILLGGGTKRRQANDVEAAVERWAEYRRRKQEQ